MKTRKKLRMRKWKIKDHLPDYMLGSEKFQFRRLIRTKRSSFSLILGGPSLVFYCYSIIGWYNIPSFFFFFSSIHVYFWFYDISQVKGNWKICNQKEGIGGFSKILVIWLLRELWKGSLIMQSPSLSLSVSVLSLSLSLSHNNSCLAGHSVKHKQQQWTTRWRLKLS